MLLRFTPTASIADNVEAIESLRARLDLRAPLARGWQGRLRRELEAEAVAASTSMEGVPVTVADAVRILAGDSPPSVSAADAALVSGYRDAVRHAFVRAEDPDFAWNAELLRALHSMAMGASRHADPGRFRDRPVWVANSLTGEVIYECPEAACVPALVEVLCEEANESDAAAPIVAALVHVGIARIHPFRDGNGRIARIAASLAMRRAGYLAEEFTSLEEWWGRHTDEYYSALRGLGTCWEADADLTSFVEVHVAAQRAQLESHALTELTERAVWIALENIAEGDLGMPVRAADALYDAFFGRTITNRYYRSIGDVSTATATNDLARLEAAGLVEARGAGRFRSYVGTFRLLAMVASECRVSVSADPTAPLEWQRATILGELAERIRGSSDGTAGR